MNRRMIFNIVGKIVLVEAALFLLPTAVSLYYNESCTASFLISAAIAAAFGGLLVAISKPDYRVIYAKEGYIVVALSWIALTMIGALPFTLSGEIPSYIDAVFETVSGFTTTGASILTNVEVLSKGLLFWRSFTHWVGGMGVLVFVMAIVPNMSERSIHVLRAEVPGPTVGKIVPRLKDTAKILYIIYLGMTLVQIVLLVAGKMPVFDSIVHAFGTAGTGGFGVRANSISGYSPYLQWVITIFMFLFGVNFNLYYMLLIKKFKAALNSTEFLVYFCIVVFAVGIIAFNIYDLYNAFEPTLRAACFQVVSIITTTGYSTADFNLWPSLSKTVLLLLMFIGACAGSTGGGIKVSRVVILCRQIRCEIQRMMHPRAIKKVRFEGKAVDKQTLTGVTNYLAVYVVSLVIVFFLISFDGFSLETNISAATSCFNNIGPGFDAVGPMASYADYSAFSKIVLSAAMLLGRLEIFPLLVIMIPSTWTKK